MTISPPVFRPITKNDDTGKIDFGTLKEVGSLWTDVNSANLGIASILLNQQSVGAAFAAAGPTIDNSSKRTLTTEGGKVTADKTEQTSTVAQKTPDKPAVPALPVSDKAEAAMVALLAASAFKPSPPPDVKAALVQSYRAYMQNIETFSNPDNYIETSPTDDSVEWLPYRVQFVMTADPGWWTRKQDYDAVAHLRFGKGTSVLNDYDCKIVSVMPAETAQIIEDFQASLQSFALALAASGAYGPFAANAELESLTEKAERLEGQRLNTSLIVSYSAPNEIRIRMRPSLTAERGNGHDLQPTSRLMTAIVRVRNRKAEAIKVVTEKVESQLLDSNTAKQMNLEPAKATMVAATAVSTTAPAKSHEMTVKLIGQFIPGPHDKHNGLVDDTPWGTDAVYSTRRPENDWDSECANKDSMFRLARREQDVERPHPETFTSIVPVWKVDPQQEKFDIKELVGVYNGDESKGVFAVAYSLNVPKGWDKLSVSFAGNSTEPLPPEKPFYEYHSVQTEGILNIPVTNPGKAKQLGIAIQFIARKSSGGDEASAVSRLILVPFDKADERSTTEASIKVTGLLVDGVNLKLGTSPTISGFQLNSLPSATTPIPATK